MGVCRERGVQLKPDQQDWQLWSWKTFFETFVILCEYFFAFWDTPLYCKRMFNSFAIDIFWCFLIVKRNVAFKTQCFVLIVMYVQVCIA